MDKCLGNLLVSGRWKGSKWGREGFQVPLFPTAFHQRPHAVPLAEVLEGVKIEVVALASPILQKGRLKQVLRVIKEKMQLADEQIKWSVDGRLLSFCVSVCVTPNEAGVQFT